MKTKIVEAECIVTIQYEDINNYKLEDIIHKIFFTDFVSGGIDAVQVTKLVKYVQIGDYE